MKKKILLFLMTAALAFPSGASAYQHEGQSHDGLKEQFFKKIHVLMMHQEELKIDDEQMTSLMNIKYAVKKAKIQANAQKELVMLDIYQELHNDSPDLDQLYSLLDQKMEASKTLSRALLKGIVDIKNILSDDQRKEMKKLCGMKKKEGHGSPMGMHGKKAH